MDFVMKKLPKKLWKQFKTDCIEKEIRIKQRILELIRESLTSPNSLDFKNVSSNIYTIYLSDILAESILDSFIIKAESEGLTVSDKVSQLIINDLTNLLKE